MHSSPLNSQNLVIVISGPSGGGKSTVAQVLCENDDTLRLSISATTRKARPDEIDGENYHFLTKFEFEENIKNNYFIEWAKYREHYYGTPKSEIDVSRKEGKDTVLEIDVNGALQIKKQHLTPANSILIFLIPSTYDILEKRLRGRNTESEDELKNRLEIAKTELQLIAQYDYCVVNPEDDVEQAVYQIRNIISAERLRINPEQTTTFLQNFGLPI
ncbi:guanylate kinase [Candidatus Poribacteria bacterium]|nr:MAG: guanylate kinase [Candidatus Poribacteria bacterium]